MNSLVLPPSPNWYSSSILACSSDNTLIYGSRQDLVVINPTTEDKPAHIKVIPYVHTQKIISVAVNRKWGSPHKHCVTTSDDKVVRLWDISGYTLKESHSNHLIHGEKVVGANFAGEQKIVSVSENGRIVIWQFNTKEETAIKDILGPKIVVTCLSICPHVTWLAGFGLKNGLLVIADLRKSGKVLYKLRGHDKTVISLSWCPVAVNIFPVYPRNRVRNESISDKSTADVVSPPDTRETPVFHNKDLKKQEVVPKDEETAQDKEVKCDNTPSVAFSAEKGDQEAKLLANGTQENGSDSNAPAEGELKDRREDESADKNVQVENIEETSVVQTNGIKDGEVTQDEDAKDTDAAVLKSEESKDNQEGETPIQCVTIEPVEETARKEFLLASSGKDGNIYIWRAGTDGRMQTFFNAAGTPKKHRIKSHDSLWITLNWITPNWLFASTCDGSLLKWILPKPLDRDSSHVVIHRDHCGSIFSIAAAVKYYSGNKWENDENITVWTTSHDRYLYNCSIDSRRMVLANYPTLGGNVCCMAASPITPTRLALGLSDGTVRVWEVGRPHTVYIHMVAFHQRISGKVTALAWHPSKEFLLAFGTTEGRIGILDTLSPTKATRLYPQYSRSAIHKLEWIPQGEGGLDNPKLYGISESKVFVCSDNLNEAPTEMSTPEKLYAYNFSWKPDLSSMIVSMKSGELLIYTPELKLLHTRYLHQKGLSNIAWHPYGKSGSTDDKDSSVSWFAATVPNDHKVYIYDFAKLCEDGALEADLILEGHFDNITSVAWEHLQGNKIVAGSDSGVAQVWDTVTGTLIASYTEPHFECIWTVMWSPMNEDYIISSVKNCSLIIWNTSEHPPVDKEELANRRKKYISAVKGKASVLLPTLEKPSPEPAKLKKQNKYSLLPLHSLGQNDVLKNCSNLKRLLRWCEEKRNNKKATLPPDSEGCKIDFLQLFGSKEQMYNVLARNEEAHQRRKRSNLPVVSSLFRGDIGECIKQAIEQRAVTAQMVSVAPMVSQTVWQKACYMYAEQLNESPDSDPVDTAMYYLACHKVQEAITCLCNNDLYKEALALTKCRFPEDDPMTLEIVEKWAKYAFLQGDFETSAACYIVLGEYEEATKVLFRRSDETLEIAVEIAELTGNKELEQAVKTRYALFKPSFDENKELLSKISVILEKDSKKEETQSKITNQTWRKPRSHVDPNDLPHKTKQMDNKESNKPSEMSTEEVEKFDDLGDVKLAGNNSGIIQIANGQCRNFTEENLSDDKVAKIADDSCESSQVAGDVKICDRSQDISNGQTADQENETHAQVR